MTHPNQQVVRDMFDAYAKGEEARLRRLLAEDVAYHIPGRNPTSGDYRRRDAVLGLWARQKEHMGGQPYCVEFRDMLVSDTHVVLLAQVTAESKGKAVTWEGANIYIVRDGQIAKRWPLIGDLYSFDDFWS